VRLQMQHAQSNKLGMQAVPVNLCINASMQKKLGRLNACFYPIQSLLGSVVSVRDQVSTAKKSAKDCSTAS